MASPGSVSRESGEGRPGLLTDEPMELEPAARVALAGPSGADLNLAQHTTFFVSKHLAPNA